MNLKCELIDTTKTSATMIYTLLKLQTHCENILPFYAYHISREDAINFNSSGKG